MRWIRAHDEPMRLVSAVLRDELGLPNTPRLKTAGTLQDKLRRDKSNLFTMDDVGGVRLQPVEDRMHQDEVVALISDRFPDCRIKDRRVQPNAGYRAVHVIVRIGIYRVEVQVRTQAQHNWAEANEKLADLVGRGIRYGELPTDPFVLRLHDVFIRAADLISQQEDLESVVRRHANVHENWPTEDATLVPLADVLHALEDARAALDGLLTDLRAAVLAYEQSRMGTEDE